MLRDKFLISVYSSLYDTEYDTDAWRDN